MRPSAMRIVRSHARGEPLVVRDEHQRRLPPPLQAEQQIDDLLAGLAVEIAGRLVGEDELAAGGTARGRARRAAARRPTAAPGNDRRDGRGRPRRSSSRAAAKASRRAGELQRQRHVLERRHGRHQMERLEHDADVGAAHQRQLVLAQAGKVVAGDLDLAARRPLEPGHDHQQRRLARAGRPDDGHRLALARLEIDVPQDLTGPARLVSVRRTSFKAMIGLVTICSAGAVGGATLVST